MPSRSFSFVSVSVSDYHGRLPAWRHRLVPPRPGIYVWTLDVSPAIRRGQGAELDRILEREIGRSRGDVGLFFRVGVTEAAPPLTADKIQKVSTLAACRNDLVDWVSWLGNITQRPLYVGKSANLKRRLDQHLEFGSRLRGYLSELGVEATDCAFSFAEVPAGSELEYVTDTELSDDENELALELDDPEFEAQDFPEIIAIDVAESIVIKLGKPHTGMRKG